MIRVYGLGTRPKETDGNGKRRMNPTDLIERLKRSPMQRTNCGEGGGHGLGFIEQRACVHHVASTF